MWEEIKSIKKRLAGLRSHGLVRQDEQDYFKIYRINPVHPETILQILSPSTSEVDQEKYIWRA
jgi:hypothetical protein